MLNRLRATALAITLSLSGFASASDLQVSPALVDVPAPNATSTVKLSTSGNAPVHAQLRVFRWVQKNGVEQLEPSRNVVVSPPQLLVRPGEGSLVRIVRTEKRPVQGEESYRLLIDQLPNASAPGQVAVKLLVRHVIPVFFAEAANASPLSWTVATSGNDLTVTATNPGAKRERVSAMRVKDGAGRTVQFGDGLVGYVLAGSTMSWTATGKGANFSRKGTASISARGYDGAINARAKIAARN